jgi:hypothetical protein
MFIAGLLITGSLLAIGHWFPWPKRLPRLAAYAYGVGCLLIGQAVWLTPTGQAALWWRLAAFAAVAGAVTAGCYGIDWALNAWLRGRHGRAE